MTDAELARLLAAIAPRLGLRVDGFRRVRSTLRKRLARRLASLGLDGHAYERYVEAHPEEWQWLDASCRITISRFGRDAPVFERLVTRSLPEQAARARARGQACVRAWSAGCASGEEAYSLAIAFDVCVAPQHPGLRFEVLGTDLDPVVLARARRAGYPPGCLRELPAALRAAAFERRGGELFVLPRYRAAVHLERADLRTEAPDGPFDIISCRNVAFTYFAMSLQRRTAEALANALRPGGVLVVGAGERVPEGTSGLAPDGPCFYTRVDERLQRKRRPDT